MRGSGGSKPPRCLIQHEDAEPAGTEEPSPEQREDVDRPASVQVSAIPSGAPPPPCRALCAPGSSHCHPVSAPRPGLLLCFPEGIPPSSGSSWMKVGRDRAAFPAGA